MQFLSKVFIALAVLAMLIFASQDVGLAAQMYLAVFGVGLVVILATFRPSGLLKYVMVGLAIMIAARYFSWRTVYSLPPISDLPSFIPGILLYSAETLGLLMFIFGLMVNIQPLRRRPVRLPADPNTVPSVDVFIPTFNEPPELLRATVLAALDLDYPKEKLTVCVLDDGGTKARLNHDDPNIANAARERAQMVEAMCADLGARYLTRADNKRAKAGNMNAALARTEGDLILVLDADHIPAREFLQRTAGYFLRNDNLALLQTPHFFRIADPIENNLGIFADSPSENEMFYGRVQRGLDRFNGAMFCGSAALLRRRPLLNIGGFAGKTVTEDAETSLQLHAAGFESCYVPRAMVSGLSPGTMAGFIGQRVRWAQGMFQLLLMRNPLLTRGLSMSQRAGYLSLMLFWLFPLSRLIFFAAPLVFLLFSLQIFQGGLQEFTVFVLPHVVVMWTLSNYFFGRYRRPFISDVYEMLQAVPLARALLSVLFRPSSPTFGVTSKDDYVDRQFLSPMFKPVLLMLLIALAAEAIGIYRYIHDTLDREHLTIVLGWNTLNIVFLMAALAAMFERPRDPVGSDVRRDEPITLISGYGKVPARLMTTTHEFATMFVAPEAADRIEPGSASLKLSVNHSNEPQRELAIDVVRQRESQSGLHLTVAYAPADREDELAVARLAYGNSGVTQTFLESRRKQRSMILGILDLLRIAAMRCMALLAHLLGALPSRRVPPLVRLHVQGAKIPATQTQLD